MSGVAQEREKEVAAAQSRSDELAEAAAEAALNARGAEETSRAAVADVRAAEAALDALTGRSAVLRDVCLRREGVPKAARAVLAAADGAALVAELLRVRSGYERAVAAALGPLASAVVVWGRRDDTAVGAADGPIEVVWPDEIDTPRRAPDGSAEDLRIGDGVAAVSGFLDLWDVVDGPAGLIAALKLLTPPTLLAPVTDVAGIEGMTVGVSALPAGIDPVVRVVHPDGRVSSWHGARCAARRGRGGSPAGRPRGVGGSRGASTRPL